MFPSSEHFGVFCILQKFCIVNVGDICLHNLADAESTIS